VVTDSSGATLYAESLDYRLSSPGDYTEIQRIPGGLIPDGGAVLVDFVGATPASTDGLLTANSHFGCRLDLFKGHLSLYTRFRDVSNSHDSTQVSEDAQNRLVGVSARRGPFQAQAEHVEHHSTLTTYRTTRCSERLHIARNRSTFGLDLQQNWTEYEDRDERREQFINIARYNRQFFGRLSWRLEGGLHNEKSAEIDRSRVSGRTGLSMSVGKLHADLSYSLYEEDTQGETRDRHTFRFKAARTF
jgi:hypothetical protein